MRLLVFVVAYNAEKTIESVLERIPVELSEMYDTEILVIDDSSKDDTFSRASFREHSGSIRFPIKVLFNPENQGYGGNQKLGYHYAIENGFDYVAMIHGDGQYAPECLPKLMTQFQNEAVGAVFGSRMMVKKDALKGGMPLYKFWGNQILTWTQNRLLGSNLSEFHSGYRVYAVAALKEIPFVLNSNEFHFDTEIIIQMLLSRFEIKESPIPTYYGDEVCHVNGMKYAKDIMVQTVISKFQKYHVFYEPKYDLKQSQSEDDLILKKRLQLKTPERHLLEEGNANERVIVFGRNGKYLVEELRKKGAVVCHLASSDQMNDFLNDNSRELVDRVILSDGLDVYQQGLEVLLGLKRKLRFSRCPKMDIIAPNVAFISIRIQLLLGRLNYTRRGILSRESIKLHTYQNIKSDLLRVGMKNVDRKSFRIPVELIFDSGLLQAVTGGVFSVLKTIFPNLFAYQFLIKTSFPPSLELLLSDAYSASTEKNLKFQKGEL